MARLIIDINNYETVLQQYVVNDWSLEGAQICFPLNESVDSYYAHETFLANHYGGNDRIFRELGLDKVEFCKKYYGYKPVSGDFPECFHGDNSALIRVTYALFEECAKRYKSVPQLPVSSINKTALIDNLEEDHTNFFLKFEEPFREPDFLEELPGVQIEAPIAPEEAMPVRMARRENPFINPDLPW